MTTKDGASIPNSATESTKRNSPIARKFYVFGPDVTGGGKGHGLVFINEEKLLTPPRCIVKPAEGGFPILKEKPHIAFDPKKGKPPQDLESSLSGYWFISERLKRIFETVDPEGFAFAECDYTLADGSKGPTHYLCDVVRTLDVLDEEKSKVKVKTERDYTLNKDVKIYSISGGGSLIFKDIPSYYHTFRQVYLGSDPICDSNIYNACIAVTDLTGISFDDAENL